MRAILTATEGSWRSTLEQVIQMQKREIPRFQSEAEEARWWFEHREVIGSDLVAASRQGRLGEGSLARHQRKLREGKEAPQTPSAEPATRSR
jgi:hypothetical protein